MGGFAGAVIARANPWGKIMKSVYRPLLFCGLLVAGLAPGGLAEAIEIGTATSAASHLGADVKGDNWTVAPTVTSDGTFRHFSVTTPYGDFEVIAERRMNDRLQELRALQVLEKMSRTQAFADALGNAGMAPIHFGVNLVSEPIKTTGSVMTGIGDMFDTVVSSVSDDDPSRDSLLRRVLGVTKAVRDLAAQLKVDPYTDYKPLHDGLEDVAKVIAAGDLTVTGAISAIPGGAGIVASATSTASDLSSTVYTMTAEDIGALVVQKLMALGDDEAQAKKFVANNYYSPADQLAIAESLENLGAANSSSFIALATAADSVELAKFHRFRAELLAKENARLGTLKDFVVVSDFALNRDANGALVAAFPFDEVAWTDSTSRNLTRLFTLVAAQNEKKVPVFASTGPISPAAAAEIKAAGWKIVMLD
jgi:hypothetical protein